MLAAMGLSAEFVPARDGDLDILHRPDVEAAAVRDAIDRHLANDAAGPPACLKWGLVSSVSRVSVRGAEGRVEVAVKLFRWRGIRGAISELLLGSRARRSLGGEARLRAAGIDTAEALAIAERRRRGLVALSFLLTRFVEGTLPLPRALEALRGTPDVGVLARALGAEVGSLHAAGIHHPDLKHLNFLVGIVPPERAGAPSRLAIPPVIRLLDLDALVPPRRLTWRRRVRALGQLEAYSSHLNPWIDRTERVRFLNAYIERNPELAADRKALVRAVREWAVAKLIRWEREFERKGLPLAEGRKIWGGAPLAGTAGAATGGAR